VQGDQLARRTQQFADWGVGGAVLMTWPTTATPAALRAMKRAGAVPLLIATDEEGGTVQRMKSLGVIPAAATVADSRTPAQAQQMIADHAEEVKAAGVDIVFAPVADVAPASGTGPIGSRAFSSDPHVVAQFDDAYVEGWKAAGVLPVLKHFPGHGSASADSHQLDAVTPPLAELEQRDLLPYTALQRSGAGVMVGHLIVPGLTEEPASLSPAAYDLLRNDYGYGDALVFTDALGMKAVSEHVGLAPAAVQAIAAGADVAIYTSTDDTPAVIEAVANAIEDGAIPAERATTAVLHVLGHKGVDPCSITPG